MKTIDVRFSASDMAEIKSMVGKRMIGYKCDPFIFSTSVYGIVGIRLEDTSYAFTNSLEVMDYFGDPEDVARFRISKVEYANIKSLVQDQVMVETPVDNVIEDVIVVNECQRLFEKDVQIYEVMVTRGMLPGNNLCKISMFKGRGRQFTAPFHNLWFDKSILVLEMPFVIFCRSLIAVTNSLPGYFELSFGLHTIRQIKIDQSLIWNSCFRCFVFEIINNRRRNLYRDLFF
jgi:hypothetical protein